MTRQAPTLQGAVIIFVMLTIVLGVTTFIFFNRCQEATMAANNSQRQSEQHRAKMQGLAEEAVELKRLINGPDSGTFGLERIREQFEKDMKTLSTFPEETRCYRTALARQQHAIGDANSELVSCKDNLRQSDACIESLEQTKVPQVRRHARAAQEAREDLVKGTIAIKQRSKETRTVYDSLRKAMQQIQHRADTERVEAKKRYDLLVDAHQKLLQKYKILEHKYQKFLGGPKVAQGRIVRVSSRLGTAWIDLGRADSLPPRTEFDVYTASAFRLAPSDKKGEIEVTKILEDHLAEASVTEDKISNPIVGGDKVHSRTWNHGDSLEQ